MRGSTVTSSLVMRLVTLLLLGAGATQASAAPITIEFIGRVHSVGDFGGPTPFAVRDDVFGRLVYEPEGATDLDSDPLRSFYRASAITEFTIRVGEYEAELDPDGTAGEIRATVNVAGSNSDSVLFKTESLGVAINGHLPGLMQFAVSDYPSSGLIRPVLPNLDDWEAYQVFLPQETGNFLVFGAPGTDARVDWRLRSYVATPEPGTGLLLLSGLCVLAARRG